MYKKTDIKKETVRFSVAIAAVIIIVGALLSFLMYFVIQKSFFQATVNHEMELMKIMESLGIQLIDSKLYDLKEETEDTARQYGEALIYGSAEEKTAVLSSMKMNADRLNYCYQTKDGLFCGKQFHGEYAAQLDLSEVWEGKTVLFSPDFDEEENYILAVAVPVWKNQQEGEIDGILIEQLDGYCISRWLGDLFLSLDLGTSYIIDETGRNIATANPENYDWIMTRYNAQELEKHSDDISTKSVARLERYALDGEIGIDTYVWENSTNYVAYGPLTEADWGFFVGFYGNEFKKYAQDITTISSRAAGVMLGAFTLFLGAIIVVVMRNLNKERMYSEKLLQQKVEIEQQALSIASSEERFRIAMQRSRDIIVEYRLETKEIICFYEGREINSGRIGDEMLRKNLVEGCCMDEDSFKRFEEAMRAISKGLTSAECMITGDHGSGRKWYRMSLSAIPNDGNTATRAVGVLRDVTGEREAELDSLTKLLNKAVMTESVRKAMQSKPKYTAGAFIMLDIDHFKMVNDKYGHPVGDSVLCSIADSLRQVFPPPYLTGRFGGDEFSVYCPQNVQVCELKNRLDRISLQVKAIQGKNNKPLGVSLSIGAVIFYGESQFEKVYKKADELMYEAKKAGRDCYRIYEEK